MSFNRSIYDKCAYSKELQESVTPLEYNLFRNKYENCVQCPVGSFTNNLEFGEKTDAESELYGLKRNLSRCDSQKYNPTKPVHKPSFTPGITCQSIYHITPTNMKMPSSNGLNNINANLRCKN
jgi:hypothetical protein